MKKEKENKEGKIKESKGKYDKRNKLNNLTAKEWIPETISVFVQKGLGAKHEDAKIEKMHPAPYSYQDVQRLINFFTKKGQKVLDPFLGVGSTLKACALSGRKGVGIELMKKYCNLTDKRLKNEVDEKNVNYLKQEVVYGDALEKIKTYEDNFFDFIVTSPPYWNILNKIDHKAKQERVEKKLDTKYSNNKKDLANIGDYKKFIQVLGDFFDDCSVVLKPEKYLCIVVSDFRHKSKFYTFHTDLSNYLEEKGNYELKGITVLYQSRKKVFPYGYPFAYVPNIHHQYILILQNVKHK